MGRLLSLGALACVLSFGPALDAAATPLLDPIVRTRGGGGSIPIDDLSSFSFNFGTFPDDPDGDGTDCSVSVNFEFDDAGLNQVTCTFQNLSGEPITVLDFDFGGLNASLEFQIFDDGGFFANVGPIDQSGALFTAGEFGGIPSFCEGEFCNVFSVDLIGFLDGSTIVMSTQPDAVPEPASLMLLGTGLLLAAAARRRRRTDAGRSTRG